MAAKESTLLIRAKRNVTLKLLNGAINMMRWYDLGYRDAAKGENNWIKVPALFPEDAMMYSDGQRAFKDGKPNEMAEFFK